MDWQDWLTVFVLLMGLSTFLPRNVRAAIGGVIAEAVGELWHLMSAGVRAARSFLPVIGYRWILGVEIPNRYAHQAEPPVKDLTPTQEHFCIMSRRKQADREWREQARRAGVITNLQERNRAFSAQTTVTKSPTVVTPNSNETTPEVTVQEAALIGKLLGQSMPPSSIVKSLPGYTPAKYKEYRAKVDHIKVAIEQVNQEL